MNEGIEVRAAFSSDPLLDVGARRELSQRYFVWDAFVGGVARVTANPLVLSADLHAKAVLAAEATVRAIGSVAGLAHASSEEQRRYRVLPAVEALAAASFSTGDLASFARVDLLLGEDLEFRACEVNSDSPGGHNEALALPEMARAGGFRDGVNPTHIGTALADRLIELAGGDAVALVHATGYAEDLQICALLKRILRERGAKAVLSPPTAPKLDGRSLRVRGEKIGVLYRYFPTEYMQGQSNVGDIVAALRIGTVRSLTAFSQIYTQSKLGFERAWALRAGLESGVRDAVNRYLPETVELGALSEERLLAERRGWVLKRAYGRVGDQVYVGELIADAPWALLVRELLGLCASGESWIAQRFVRQHAIPTPWGPRLVTLGAYVLDGRFVGYFARVTPESHVSHDAMCVPVFVEGAAWGTRGKLDGLELEGQCGV